MTPVPLTRPDQTPDQRRATIEAAELPQSVPALLDEAVRDSPDQMLWDFFDDGTQTTYAQGQHDSRRMAALLAELGCGGATRWR